MSQERRLKVRPVPPTSKGGPFRAYVSVQVLEHFGGKSETAAWILGKTPVPVTLWREQPPAKGAKQEALGNNVVQVSETVRQLGRLNLEDPVTVLREESAWIPNAYSVVLEETYERSVPQLDGINETEAQRQERVKQDKEDRIRRRSLQDPAFQALLRNEVAVCGQQIEVTAEGGSSKLIVRQVDGSQAGGLHWVTDDTQVEVTRRQNYEMKMPRDRIAGLREQMDHLDYVLEDYGSTRRTSADPNESFSDFILLSGPPGGGKTTLMKALGRLAWPKVFRLSSDSRSSAKIRNTLNDARHFGRALVVVDDIEKAAKSEQSGQMNNFCVDLLKSMSELRKDRGARILLVAATRDPKDIHSRLLEADGWDDNIRCGLPNIEGRKDFLRMRLEKSGAPEEALDEIARMTHAFSNKDLEKLVRGLGKIKSRAGSARQPPGTSFGSLSDASAHSIKDWLVYADQALKKVSPSVMLGLHVEVPETRFSDIGGQQELKDRLRRELYRPIVHAEALRKYNVKPLKGMLMYGPPGCSKTLMARALATEFRFNFLLVNASELISSYVGESEKQLREIFRQARDVAPCILFFDEFETIGATRGGRDAHGGLKIVQTLLTEMDGVRPLEMVFVLAATNTPEALDPALLRPGRLHPHVLIDLPDHDARKDIVKITLGKLPDSLVSDGVDDVKISEFAERTKGFTGAQMSEFVDGAARMAGLGHEQANAEHFEKMLRSMSVTVTEDDMERYREWKA